MANAEVVCDFDNDGLDLDSFSKNQPVEKIHGLREYGVLINCQSSNRGSHDLLHGT